MAILLLKYKVLYNNLGDFGWLPNDILVYAKYISLSNRIGLTLHMGV